MPKVRLKQLAQEGATDGQVIEWDNAAGEWAPATPSGGGGGGADEAGSISNVTFTGNPKSATITFATFAPGDTNFTVLFTVLGTKSFDYRLTAKTSTNFTVTLGTNNAAGLTQLDWAVFDH